jgi:hypothetical protein
MSAKKHYREGARGHWRPAGRVLPGGEGDDSGYERKPLSEALADIARVERGEAMRRQDRAGIKGAIRTNFLHNGDTELEAALAKVWAAGDPGKKLYVRIGKGLVCMTREDVVALVFLTCEEIEAVAGDLIAGKTLKEAAES